MSSQMPLTLCAGPLELELNPGIGGSIANLCWTGAGDRRAILRACAMPCDKVLDAASFPLVPFVNRIRGGAFHFRGRDVRLAPNMAGDKSPLHGQGWLAPWTLDEASSAHARLSFSHEAGEWPWDYAAWQEARLDDNGLSLSLGCRNMSSEPMPCGLGQHPYFPCGPGTRLDTDVVSAWTVDADVLPVDEVAANGRYSLRDRAICGQGLDNGFGGWSGSASMTDPDWPFDLRLSSPQAKFFQVYSPSEGGIFVAEPVTQANAALNAPESEWSALGMRVLDPGEAMTLDMRLDVLAKRAG